MRFSPDKDIKEPLLYIIRKECLTRCQILLCLLELPEVEKYLPTEDGDPPLGNAKTFAWDEANQKVVDKDLIDDKTVFPLELSTMPGWAGSSWYFLRYID